MKWEAVSTVTLRKNDWCAFNQPAQSPLTSIDARRTSRASIKKINSPTN
jgi:hypothetical protein